MSEVVSGWQLRCPWKECGHQWFSRVPPKDYDSCPRCHQSLTLNRPTPGIGGGEGVVAWLIERRIGPDGEWRPWTTQWRRPEPGELPDNERAVALVRGEGESWKEGHGQAVWRDCIECDSSFPVAAVSSRMTCPDHRPRTEDEDRSLDDLYERVAEIQHSVDVIAEVLAEEGRVPKADRLKSNREA